MAIPLSEFVKFYPLRAMGLTWFFGAGSSISGGVPSANDLIWDFKRRIYCAEQALPLSIYNNLTDSGIREQIQNYFARQNACPPYNSPEEYSYYFERAFSSAIDRSQYISQQTLGLQLTYGHKVMGILMKHKFINIIFTTNFDKAFENICTTQFQKLEDWYAADLDSGDNGMKFFQSGKRPLIVKLHGDYFSDNIKNTSSELQSQDKKLRDILSLSQDTTGLCVMGYSGRDKSIMDILNEAIKKSSSLPNGLFWFIMAGTEPLPEVLQLINDAKDNGKQAEIIEIETFDTAWADIIKGFDTIPNDDLEKLNQNYYRLNNQPIPHVGNKYPLIRMNGLPILSYPATARLFKCDAGNTKEVIDLINKSSVSILAVRKRLGIVGFGADEDFVKAFNNYGRYDLDIFQITEKDLKFDDSAMKGLLTSSLLKALAHGKPLRHTKRRQKHLLFVDPNKTNDLLLNPLKKIFPNLKGTIPGSTLVWTIGLEVNIQFLLGKPLLVLSPTVIAQKAVDKNVGKLIAPFIKEFMAQWYNQKYDAILNSWLEILFEDKKEIIINSFEGMTNGINSSFKIARTTAYTRTN